MATLAGSASFPGIHTAAGTGPGGSASPSRLDTTSLLGMIGYEVTAAELHVSPAFFFVLFFHTRPDLKSRIKERYSVLGCFERQSSAQR